jgi:predicted Zn-dependent protease
MKTPRSIALALAVVLAGLGLAACSSPESKVASFSQRGHELLQKGDLVKARLEFQNALQVNPSAVPALYGLALVAERSRDWRASYELLGKVVELQPTHVDALVRMGKLQLAAGQMDKAAQTAQAAAGVQPQSPDVLGLQAAIALKMNNAPHAVALARQALAGNARHIDSLVVLATERLQAGDGEGGIAFLDHGIAADPRNVSLHMLKVQALERLGQTDRAEAVLHTLVGLFPEDIEYRHLLASFYVAHKLPAKAEAEYRAVVAANPKATAAKLQLVQFLESSRGPAAAATELEGFVRADPRAHDLKLALAQLRLQQKQDAAAIALWKEVIADAKDAAGIRARGSLATYHLQRGEKEPARTLVTEMLAKDGRDEQGLFLRAALAIDDRKLDEAVADLRTILRDTPDSARTHLVLARTHELQGLPDLAMQHFANAAQAGRYAPPFALPYARQLLRTGRTRQAEGVLRDALRVAPGNVPVLGLLVDALLRSGDVAGAQTVADQLAGRRDTDPVASQILGAVQLARHDYTGGIDSFKRAYALAPNDLQALSAVARSYMAAGKTAEALAFVQAAADAAPRQQGVRVMLAQLQAQTGNPAAAAQTLQAAIAIDPAKAMPYQALATLRAATRDTAGALAAADQGLKVAPRDFSLRLTRAGVLEAAGRSEEAIAAYETMLAEQPNAVIVANNLASLLADHRKDQASLRRAYDIAQRFRGSDIPHLKDTLGWTMHLVGKHAEAAELLKSARQQAPELAIVQYHYGMNQLVLNNPRNAREALARAVELAKAAPFPQQDDARKALESL